MAMLLWINPPIIQNVVDYLAFGYKHCYRKRNCLIYAMMFSKGKILVEIDEKFNIRKIEYAVI